MKRVISFLFVLLFYSQIFPQTAQSYFPSQLGFKWTFRATTLDSLNNPITSLTFYQIDSFAVIQEYKGRLANHVLSKTGNEQTILLQPYTDTTYLSFQNNDAYNYFELLNFNFLPNYLNKNSEYSFYKLQPGSNPAFEGWFAYYRFASAVNVNYLVFTKDTSITIDTVTIPLRIELRGRRLNDQTVITQIGTFNCKKFLLTTIVSYLPLPILPIPLYQLRDTSWIAQGNWIVKQILPSSVIDLSPIGLPRFVLPGTSREIIPPLTTDVEQDDIFNTSFYLAQNYPNPFNPFTKIEFRVPFSGIVSLKVYDILGNEIAVLVNDYKTAGKYEVDFNASNLVSGIYFYKLIAGDFSETRKMVLLR